MIGNGVVQPMGEAKPSMKAELCFVLFFFDAIFFDAIIYRA